MNIISIVPYPFLPARSGGQKCIAQFYKYFSRLHPVTIVSTKKNQHDLSEGYVLLNMLSNSRLRYINPFLFFRISKLIREKRATHLIIEHPYYGWLGILLKKFCRIRLVVRSHNIESTRWKSMGKWWWRILWTYEKFIHRQADYNFFIQDEDKKFAIREYGVAAGSCITISFGTEMISPPPADERSASRKILGGQLKTDDSVPLLLFNGAFGYLPNRQALENILFKVNPILQARGLKYLLLIIGLDIPEAYREAIYPSVRVLGFVENLDLYLTGCQVFLNPVIAGGGIKTKLVESLAYDLTTVSSAKGAVGVDPERCNHKLIISADNDWDAFASAISDAIEIKTHTPPEFYKQFYWANIAAAAAGFIRDDGFARHSGTKAGDAVDGNKKGASY